MGTSVPTPSASPRKVFMTHLGRYGDSPLCALRTNFYNNTDLLFVYKIMVSSTEET